jgi:hypothetical protein
MPDLRYTVILFLFICLFHIWGRWVDWIGSLLPHDTTWSGFRFRFGFLIDFDQLFGSTGPVARCAIGLESIFGAGLRIEKIVKKLVFFGC